MKAYISICWFRVSGIYFYTTEYANGHLCWGALSKLQMHRRTTRKRSTPDSPRIPVLLGRVATNWTFGNIGYLRGLRHLCGEEDDAWAEYAVR